MRKRQKKNKKFSFRVSPFFIAAALIIIIGLSFGAKKHQKLADHGAAQMPSQEECTVVKYRYYTGNFQFRSSKKHFKGKSPEEVAQVIDTCSQAYPEFWKKLPTVRQCSTIRKYKALGTLSAMIEKGKVDGADSAYCASKAMRVTRCQTVARYQAQHVLTDTIQAGSTDLEWIDVIACKKENTKK